MEPSEAWWIVAGLPIAWAVGTFPTAVLVARVRGVDVLGSGSGNPGASNVLRLLGVGWFVVVMAVDVAKGAAAAGTGLALGGRPGAYALGIAAVVGHTLPIWRRGGKGVAAAGGTMAVLFPWVTVGAAVVWALLAQVLKRASLASLVVTIGFPVAAGATGHRLVEVVVLAALAVLLVLRHAANIRRLVEGDEPELRAPRP